MKIESMPVKSTLKVEGGFDLYEFIYEDIDKDDIDYDIKVEMEKEAYRDWMSWFMSRDFEPLALIPRRKGSDFWVDEWEKSAFNTSDFRRLYPKPAFSLEHWLMKETLNRVNDLAIMHSCISTKPERDDVYKRYMAYVGNQFGAQYRAALFVNNYRKADAIQRKIRKCNQVWLKWNPEPDSD
jgi:hypothetical protein